MDKYEVTEIIAVVGMESVRAVYRHGVLVPENRLDLKEGEEVIIVLKKPSRIDRYFGIFKKEDVEKVIEEIENEGVL
ncbi:antitoxin family protein [Thermococcus thioreducens]|uniref:Antitoxin n=1 Tax=Thermococcus thioreducens TaxID=277988 RepID=A0A0Q2QRG5_9EURY|nr:antitoxin family protein [Thermococcus thioreducens]ASJ11693.1 hypothetical protein A3L14_01775 [Thermococcus thioreducens]KQH82573.1 hypothetical protein AMR53_04660 [Thermococcus thioreducens]SEW15467.1 Protein of unknown function DUF104 [Thermococcus thioreducens]